MDELDLDNLEYSSSFLLSFSFNSFSFDSITFNKLLLLDFILFIDLPLKLFIISLFSYTFSISTLCVSPFISSIRDIGMGGKVNNKSIAFKLP